MLFVMYCPSGKETLRLYEDFVKTKVSIIIPTKSRPFTSLTELSNNLILMCWSGENIETIPGGKG